MLWSHELSALSYAVGYSRFRLIQGRYEQNFLVSDQIMHVHYSLDIVLPT